MATHLVEIVRKNLHEIFGRQELSALLEQLKLICPKVISELNPEVLPVAIMLKVFQNLLREQVSIRDLRTVLECLADHAGQTKDAWDLTEYARVSLGRTIAQQHLASDQTLYAITLPRALEERLLKSVSNTQGGPQIALEPTLAKAVVEQIGQEAKKNLANNQPPVVLTSQQVRPHLYRLIERFIPNLAVLSHNEVAGHVRVRPVAMIGEAA
jgi:flagellar biosynthesis protein FlhA